MKKFSKLLNTVKNNFNNFFAKHSKIDEVDEITKQKKLRTGPSDKNYYNNIYNWRYPTEEFITNVQFKCSSAIKKKEYNEIVDINNCKQNCVKLRQFDLFNDTIENNKFHFDNNKDELIHKFFSESSIKVFIEKLRVSNIDKLINNIFISQFKKVYTESIYAFNFFVQGHENHSLIIHAIDKPLIYHFFNDYFNSLQSNDELELFINSNENILVWYRSIIKVLTYKLKDLDKKVAFELVSNALNIIECERDQLKREKGYPDTFDDWEKFLKMRQKHLKRLLSDSLINSIITSKENLRLFQFNDYVVKHEQLGNIFIFLKKHKFIHTNAEMSDFKDIFNNRFTNMIHWIGTKNELVYFIKLMKNNGVFVENNEYLRAIWICFLYNNRNEDYKKEKGTLKQISHQVTHVKPPNRAKELDELTKFFV